MLIHIVMWTLKDHAEGADKASNLLKMKALLDGCNNIVPGMLKFDAVVSQPGLESTCDIVLYSEFESKEALDAYQEHPTHVAIKPFIGAVRDARHCIDYLT